VITNGFFTKDAARVRETARQLAAAGVNDLLLSVDAFHQETIPLDAAMGFAREAKACGIPLRISPAWLVSAAHDNPYNRKTREILDGFSGMKIPVGEGNVIFPEGNALKYLSEYFEGEDSTPENPYVEDPCDVRCVSFASNGDVLDGNVYQNDILEIINAYSPKAEREMNKIIVIGCPGSGKTTFSEKLRDKLRLPLFYLDAIWHKPDRTHISREEFDARLSEILALDSWIIDGNYSRTVEKRLLACDTVILFDLPTEECLDGAISRLGKKRCDVPWIDTELDPRFEKEILEFGEKNLPAVYELIEKYGKYKKVEVFKSRREADEFLSKIEP
jgi:adenylate kinase family enzyme